MASKKKPTSKAPAKKPCRTADSGSNMTQTERLIRLEQAICNCQATQGTHLSQINDSIMGLRDEVRGLQARADESQYGTGGKPGNVIKIDRLEQSAAQAKMVVRLLLGAVVTLCVGAVWSIMARGSL
mgnify:CR=1 FL=1